MILPFLNLSREASANYLVDGIVDTLITDLSSVLPGSFIIPRSTAFTYKGRSVPIRQIGKELGVRYVLQGSVLVDPSRVRVQAVFPRSGFLVRRENFHPGWAAQLDGVPVTITRWSSAFQAVAVSAGRHTVDFAFRSPYPVLMWLHFVAVIAGYVWFARALVDGVAESPKRREAWGA